MKTIIKTLQRTIELLLKVRTRAVIYILAFFTLWGYEMSKFVFNKPVDVLANSGQAIFVPALTHEDVVLMIGRGAIMYSIFLILGFSCIEGCLKIATNTKTFFKAFIIIFIFLAIVEGYWERNYHSFIF